MYVCRQEGSTRGEVQRLSNIPLSSCYRKSIGGKASRNIILDEVILSLHPKYFSLAQAPVNWCSMRLLLWTTTLEGSSVNLCSFNVDNNAINY